MPRNSHFGNDQGFSSSSRRVTMSWIAFRAQKRHILPVFGEELHAFYALLVASGQAKQPQATKVILNEAIQRFGDLYADGRWSGDIWMIDMRWLCHTGDAWNKMIGWLEYDGFDDLDEIWSWPYVVTEFCKGNPQMSLLLITGNEHVMPGSVAGSDVILSIPFHFARNTFFNYKDCLSKR